VVPILRNADQMSLADIEKKIAEFGAKAKDGKLTLEDLTGGTFSISNGGTFGSMLSTPIINPPQSAILGVHATKDRAVVENGQIVVRPMNYLAMSYDHRIIDGREAVLGLVAMKEALEDPPPAAGPVIPGRPPSIVCRRPRAPRRGFGRHIAPDARPCAGATRENFP
jgi:2-oxoglutarate dehydrogenase E2 component (dihydrolipoamide succinyltransferase)